MLRIEPQGDGVYRLVDGPECVVGFVRGTSIRIGTFATQDDAVRAALRGDRVIDAHLRGGPDRSPAGETAHVRAAVTAKGARTGYEPSAHSATGQASSQNARLIHDGAYEWIVLDRRLLARLVRPSSTTLAFAIEFVVPDVAPWDARLTIARELHRALTSQEVAVARVTPPLQPTADEAPSSVR